MMVSAPRSLLWHRRWAHWEAASFLVLMCIAMPLKYGLGLPLAVRIAGSAHGILFLLFLAALYRASLELSWPVKRWLGLLGIALIPAGPFFWDRALREP
jgi:integral membrane protein